MFVRTAQKPLMLSGYAWRIVPDHATMKPNVYVTSVLAFFFGGILTYTAIRLLGKGSPQLAFIVGSIVGVQLSAVAHHRNLGSVNSAGVKARIGLALALSALALGLALHAMHHPFKFPEVTIPFAVVGAFIFPFVLFDTMWKALRKAA